MHSHVAGRKMKLRHIREGVEMDRIVEDDNYDFNYQQVRQLENETNILPGDYLITDCAYEVSFEGDTVGDARANNQNLFKIYKFAFSIRPH